MNQIQIFPYACDVPTNEKTARRRSDRNDRRKTDSRASIDSQAQHRKGANRINRQAGRGRPAIDACTDDLHWIRPPLAWIDDGDGRP